MSNWAATDEELGGICRHCHTCFNVKKCTMTRGDKDACPVVTCTTQGCDWKFHGCKQKEHKELCPLERVQCLNLEYGCEMEMQRKDIVVHLPKCPANVITCSQEWNRWPLHCRERWKTIPFQVRNPRAESGQLDYELAVRDKKMVGEFYKVPRKTKLALRNNLTRRNPALPLPPHTNRKKNPTDKSLKSLKESVKFEVGDENILDRAVYGVAKIFLKNQQQQEKRWKEDVDHAIARTGKPVPKRYWEFPELEKGNIHKHCAYCFNIDCDKHKRFMDSEDEDEDDEWSECCQMVNCQWKCGAVYHHCKASEHKMICPLYEEEGEFDWMHRDGIKIVSKVKKLPPPPLKQFPDLLQGPTVDIVSHTSGGTSRFTRCKIPPAPPPPANLTKTMRFDIKIETVTRLQQKPRAMFTFLCAQEFRRDQWESHCRNVHSDIHGGLNNWIEARCPLSSYGCGFSTRRIYPGEDKRSKIVFSQDINSFGIRPGSDDMIPGPDGCLTLTDLPLELLQLVFSFLDSWSLSNLALVSVRCRELVAGLLDTKGCVALQWEKQDNEGMGTASWIVAYRRWFFSSHFTPVNNWGFNADGAVTEHLKTCPFNIKTVHMKPDIKGKEWKNFMSSLNKRLKAKRESEWYIE